MGGVSPADDDVCIWQFTESSGSSGSAERILQVQPDSKVSSIPSGLPSTLDSCVWRCSEWVCNGRDQYASSVIMVQNGVWTDHRVVAVGLLLMADNMDRPQRNSDRMHCQFDQSADEVRGKSALAPLASTHYRIVRPPMIAALPVRSHHHALNNKQQSATTGPRTPEKKKRGHATAFKHVSATVTPFVVHVVYVVLPSSHSHT